MDSVKASEINSCWSSHTGIYHIQTQVIPAFEQKSPVVNGQSSRLL